jgi:hypothetical protein
VVSWPHFKALCQQRFVLAMGVNHLAQLARVLFRTTVDDYIKDFQTQLAHAGHLLPEQQAWLFTGGLPDTIHVDVELQVTQEL